MLFERVAGAFLDEGVIAGEDRRPIGERGPVDIEHESRLWRVARMLLGPFNSCSPSSRHGGVLRPARSSALLDQHGAEVVDVGERRAGHEQIADAH